MRDLADQLVSWSESKRKREPMQDIQKILSEIDVMRERWEKLIEEGKSEPEWKQKVTINFTDRFNKKELCGLDLKVAEFLGDLMVSTPRLFEILPSIRSYIQKLEREAEAGAKLLDMLESCNHKYQGLDWQRAKSYDEQVISCMDVYRTAVQDSLSKEKV